MEVQCPNTFLHKVFHILLVILGSCLILSSLLYFNSRENFLFKLSGSVLLIFSLFLFFYPLYIFKKKGGLPEKKGFVQTTKLVSEGFYSIVRHPQYLGGILFGFSLIRISQHS